MPTLVNEWIYQTPAELFQDMVDPNNTSVFHPFRSTTTREFVVQRGFRAVKLVRETVDFTNIDYLICMTIADGEPMTARAALQLGAACIGGAEFIPFESTLERSFAVVDAEVSVMAAWLAEALDYFTNGSTEEPVRKFISAAADHSWAWTYYIPIATDAAYFVAVFQYSAFRQIEGDNGNGVHGRTPMPPQSVQAVAGSAGALQAAILDLTKAVRDAGARTTIVGFNHQGPLWAMESSELIDSPETP